MCVFECRLQAIPPFAAKLTYAGEATFCTPHSQNSAYQEYFLLFLLVPQNSPKRWSVCSPIHYL